MYLQTIFVFWVIWNKVEHEEDSGMTLRRELLIWFIFFAIAAAGVYLLASSLQETATADSPITRYLLDAAPAASAALALPALFLLLRFFLNSPLCQPSPSRSRHIIAAILLSLTAIATWEAFQIYLQGSSFTFSVFIGALLGSLLFWLFWQMTKKWMDNGHSRHRSAR